MRQAPVLEETPRALLQWANFIIAPALAITEIGCFYGATNRRRVRRADKKDTAVR